MFINGFQLILQKSHKFLKKLSNYLISIFNKLNKKYFKQFGHLHGFFMQILPRAGHNLFKKNHAISSNLITMKGA